MKLHRYILVHILYSAYMLHYTSERGRTGGIGGKNLRCMINTIDYIIILPPPAPLPLPCLVLYQSFPTPLFTVLREPLSLAIPKAPCSPSHLYHSRTHGTRTNHPYLASGLPCFMGFSCPHYSECCAEACPRVSGAKHKRNINRGKVFCELASNLKVNSKSYPIYPQEQ